jgi:two-component sensor histidine kinase
LPAGFAISTNASMGMRLIHGLIKQLKGKLTTRNEGGFSIGIVFQQDDTLKTVAV